MNKDHKDKKSKHDSEKEVKPVDGGEMTTQDDTGTGDIGGDGPGPIPPVTPPVPPLK